MCLVCRHIDGRPLNKDIIVINSGQCLITNCKRIKNIPADFTQMPFNTRIRIEQCHIRIENCPNLETIAPSPTVQSLSIYLCQRLIKIPKFDNLISLYLSKCDRLISIAKMLFLQRLTIWECHLLVTIPIYPLLKDLNVKSPYDPVQNKLLYIPDSLCRLNPNIRSTMVGFRIKRMIHNFKLRQAQKKYIHILRHDFPMTIIDLNILIASYI